LNIDVAFGCRMNVYYKVAVFILVCSTTVSSLHAGRHQESLQDIRGTLYACGYNSLYLFLRLKGHQTDFEALKSDVVIGENGTSFHDLQIATANVGVQTETVHCSYSSLCSSNMPVIAWISRISEVTQSKEPIIGHFIVLVVVNADGVEYIDGTSGEKSTMHQTKFIEQWNGMILKEKNKTSFMTDKMALSVFLIGIASILLRWGGTPKRMVSTALVCLMICPLSFCYASSSTRIWRTKENESINALYLLLRSHDLPCSYDSLETELKPSLTPQNISRLRDIARKNGLNVEVFRCSSPDALNQVSIPFLIHVEGCGDTNDAAWKGNFLLVIGRGHGHYLILNCGTIGVAEVSEEMFRRYWSGFVLGKSLQTTPPFFRSQTFSSSMFGLSVFLLYLGVFAKKRLHLPVAVLTVLVLLFVPESQADENPPPATYTPEQVKAALLETANNLESLKVYYRSEYYTDPKAPPKSYLYRKVLAKSPYYLNHTNSHPCDALSWENDPFIQQAYIQGTIGFNIFPFRNNYFVMKYKSNDPPPGSLPGEFFFNATGIWPMNERKAPTWKEVPCALRDVAQNANYDQVHPVQEKIDGRWCHILCWPNNDILWLDMERGAALLAREIYHFETGVLMFRYELSDHQEAAPDLWIPKKLRNIQFDYAAQTEEGRNRRVIDGFFDVEEMEVNTLTEADFDFTPPPGALLTYDAREPNVKYPYQSVPGGEEMLDSIADWIRAMHPQKKVISKTDWGWAVGLIVVPVILLFEIRRRKQNARDFK